MSAWSPVTSAKAPWVATAAQAAAHSAMEGEELRPMFESVPRHEFDQPDPEPDVSLPNSFPLASAFVQLPAGPWRPKPFVMAPRWQEAGMGCAFAQRADMDSMGKPLASLLPKDTRRNAASGASKLGSPTKFESGFQAIRDNGTLRIVMVIVLTSLCSLNMIALTAAKHAAGEGAFKFEYVTVTLLQESIKFVIAAICLRFEVWRGTAEPKADLTLSLLWNPSFLQFGIPGLLYCLDNNFQYVILGFLQPAELAILWNFKIFATTLLLHAFMNRRYTQWQWLSMAMLVFGCAATQASDLIAGRGEGGRGAVHLATAAGASQTVGHISRAVADFQESAPTAVILPQPPSKLVGVGLAFFGSSIAASGNVFCEYLVKDKFEDCIHVQNMQLYFFGILLNLSTLLIKATTDLDSPIHGSEGFFTGYSNWVWLVIGLSAINGLAVSVTLKYVDNIAVIFAHALSMIVVAVASAEFFGMMLSVSFVFGGFLVMASLYMFYGDDQNEVESRGGVKDFAKGSHFGAARSSQNSIGQAAQEAPMYCLDRGC